MSRTFLAPLAVALLLGITTSASQGTTQQGQSSRPNATPPEAATPPPPRAPEPSGQPVNVKIDLTITDQLGPGDPARKVITLIVADRQNGYIRSRGNVRISEQRSHSVTINVDARPIILKEGSVRLELGLEYQPTPPGTGGQPTTGPGSDPFATNLNERVGVILEPGKPLVVSQAVDPASDRKIAVELRATILK
jgi:hypothetical protein